jgi:ubiquinone biosynthesis protein
MAPGRENRLPGGRLGLLDFGMTGRLDNDLREELEGVLIAAVDNDPERVTDHVLRIANVPNNIDRNSLKRDIDDFLCEYVNITIDDIDISTSLNTLTDILREHHILLPAGMSLLLRVLVMLEGTSRLLDRSFSLADLIKPYAVKSIQRRYSPKKLFTQVRSNYRDWDRSMKIVPRELHDFIVRVRDGKFDISVEHRSLEKVTEWLVHGILSAALFLGGSMIISQKIPPLIWGTSAIGATTCLIGLFLGFRFIRAMNNSHHKG